MAATLAVLSVLGGPLPGAGAQLPPGITFPPSSTTSTPTTTTPPTSAPPATTPTTAPETKIVPVPPPTAPAGAAGATPTADNNNNSSTTTTGVGPTTTRVAPASLTPGQVDAALRDQQRTGARTTAGLVEALKPLTNLGMSPQEALALGMGQFPLLGVANWTDDWLDPRAGSPPRQHQGTDVFAAFDVPVRAPVDGIVRFEDAGLGGKAAFVTTPDGTFYYLAHLNSFHPDLASGAAVKQGQIIAYNGDSGNAKGGAPHVHFEFHPGGGAAVNPKPILDGWLQAALDRVPALLASFQPGGGDGTPGSVGDGVPQVLVSTGLTRRFSAPSLAVPNRDRPAGDFNYAVLRPLTPAVLAPMLEPSPS